MADLFREGALDIVAGELGALSLVEVVNEISGKKQKSVFVEFVPECFLNAVACLFKIHESCTR